MTRDPALAAYFAEGASWDADRAAQTAHRVRIAWIVATVGWVCAIASSIAIAFLTPLKSVTPFVIRVDNATGIVDVVPQYTGNSPVPETVTRYLLRHYVDVCERFVWATAESDYHECGAFNSGLRNQAWASLWALSNPSSPLNVYQDGTTIAVRVTSVSFFKRANGINDLAQVRYIKAKRTGEGGAEQITRWITTIQYTYTKPSNDPSVRQWNPIGFRVLDFRPEPEVSADPSGVPVTPKGAS